MAETKVVFVHTNSHPSSLKKEEYKETEPQHLNNYFKDGYTIIEKVVTTQAPFVSTVMFVLEK